MIRFILTIYIYIIIIDVILSYLPHLAEHPLVQTIRKIANLTTEPIRKLLAREPFSGIIPKDFPFDLAPVIVVVGIILFKSLW